MIWAALSAALLGLAIPPLDWHAFVWLGWVPLLHACSVAGDRRGAAQAGALWGALFYGLLFRWMLRLPWVAYAGGILAGCAFGAAFAAAVFQLKDRPAWIRVPAVAFAWVLPLLVALNPIKPFLGTVIFLDGVHVRLPPEALQLAAVVGEAGLSCFIVLINALLWTALEERSRPKAAAAYGAVAAIFLSSALAWGNSRMRQLPASVASGFKLACAQTDLPYDMAWRRGHADEIFAAYEKMSLEAARAGASMVLFPEYDLPENVYKEPGRWADLARRAKLYLALGTYASDVPGLAPGRSWVMGLVFSPDGKLAGEQKAMHPSPVARFRVDAGTTAEPVAIPALGGLALLPCFDDVTPRTAGLFSRSSSLSAIGAIANDSMFLGTIHPELHLLRSRLRAVETGKLVVHCTPGGVSAVIDARGRVLDSLPSGRGLLWHQF